MDYTFLSIEALVKKCAENTDPDAWKEFDRRFKRLMCSAIVSVCRQCSVKPQDVAEDILQEVYAKLIANNCSIMVRFQHHHENAFAGYLKSMAASVSWDWCRALHADKRDISNTVELNEAVNEVQGSYGSFQTAEMVLFFDEVDRLLREGDYGTRERAIFWLYYHQRFTAKEIAAIPAFRLTVKGVESVIHRMTDYLRRSFLLEPVS